FIQLPSQERLLQETKSVQLKESKELAFVIKEKTLINRKEVLKVKIMSGGKILSQRRLLAQIDGECVCEIGRIFRANITDNFQTIDEFIENNQFKSTDGKERKSSNVSFLSPTARYKREGIFFVMSASSSDLQLIGQKDKGVVEVLADIKNA